MAPYASHDAKVMFQIASPSDIKRKLIQARVQLLLGQPFFGAQIPLTKGLEDRISMFMASPFASNRPDGLAPSRSIH